MPHSPSPTKGTPEVTPPVPCSEREGSRAAVSWIDCESGNRFARFRPCEETISFPRPARGRSGTSYLNAGYPSYPATRGVWPPPTRRVGSGPAARGAGGRDEGGSRLCGAGRPCRPLPPPLVPLINSLIAAQQFSINCPFSNGVRPNLQRLTLLTFLWSLPCLPRPRR